MQPNFKATVLESLLFDEIDFRGRISDQIFNHTTNLGEGIIIRKKVIIIKTLSFPKPHQPKTTSTYLWSDEIKFICLSL